MSMKNSYLIAGAIVIVIALFFVFSGRKSEAPVEESVVTEEAITVLIAGDYRLNTEESFVSWEGEYLTGLKEQGTVKLQSGNLTVSDGSIVGGEFVVDLNTITSEPYIERLVNHLKSDDFFGVETYPTAKFVLKTFEPTTGDGSSLGRYVIAGDMTIRDITLPISIIATVTEEDDTLIAKSSFALNRADWEIKYNSASFFSNLGDRVIRDAIVIGLDLKAQKVIE